VDLFCQSILSLAALYAKKNSPDYPVGLNEDVFMCKCNCSYDTIAVAPLILVSLKYHFFVFIFLRSIKARGLIDHDVRLYYDISIHRSNSVFNG
jgi:hypothetical protein